MPFLACIEQSEDIPASAAVQCAQKAGLNMMKILECATSPEGNKLEHDMAVKTDKLNPAHQYVPWFTVNGIHTEEIQNQAQEDLLKLICDTYQGPKPEACTPAAKARACERN